MYIKQNQCSGADGMHWIFGTTLAFSILLSIILHKLIITTTNYCTQGTRPKAKIVYFTFGWGGGVECLSSFYFHLYSH